MSGQFSASLSLDELPERIGTTPTLGPRSARAPADWLGTSDTGTDRRALEAPAPASRRRDGELGLQVGILLHLACIAFVGTVIIVVFFGIALSLLGHRTGEVIVNSGARDHHTASVGAKPEMLLSTPGNSADTYSFDLRTDLALNVSKKNYAVTLQPGEARPMGSPRLAPRSPPREVGPTRC